MDSVKFIKASDHLLYYWHCTRKKCSSSRQVAQFLPTECTVKKKDRYLLYRRCRSWIVCLSSMCKVLGSITTSSINEIYVFSVNSCNHFCIICIPILKYIIMISNCYNKEAQCIIRTCWESLSFAIVFEENIHMEIKNVLLQNFRQCLKRKSINIHHKTLYVPKQSS